jgi:hypothetical protein
MKRFFLLLVVVIMLVPTGTWAKGGSYTRKAAIPIVASIVTPASFTTSDLHETGLRRSRRHTQQPELPPS